MADWITTFREQLNGVLQEMGRDVYRSCGEAVPIYSGIPSRENMSELSVSFNSESHPVVSAGQGMLHCEVSCNSLPKRQHISILCQAERLSLSRLLPCDHRAHLKSLSITTTYTTDLPS